MGDEWIGSSPVQEDLGVLVNEKFDLKQQYNSVHLEPGKPGLHQKPGQEVKGCDSCWVGPGILHLSLWSSAQEGHEPFRVKRAQKRVAKMIRGMKHLSYEERLR